MAFGGILAPRADNGVSRHVVYCKPGKQVTFGSGSGGGNPSNGNSTLSSTLGSASRTSGRPTSTSASSNPTSTIPASSPWKLVESHEGGNFFDGWDFFTSADPTEGIVDYLDQNSARSNGLLEINGNGNAVMRVETTSVVPGNRKSVRITTQSQFYGALFIMDSVHMPTGCGIWPAFWTNGPNWPLGGEIDIVEGVNDYTNNQATVHTDIGCTLASSSSNTLAISGKVIGGTNCAALTTGNQGCGIRAATSNSFGAAFNANNGGVYAMKWDSTGVAVYFFPRGTEPADIAAGVPQPDTWGAAQARWPAASCDPFKFFNNHHAIFDTTLCGQWAGAVWSSSGIPGQEQSCAQKTGFSTCEAFVRANGAAMNEAYWEVKSVTIYQLR
ncbi:glycoside hydrolase family 16 protein [Hebeloma cylindrosporum]|uniref:Glycoside hydrolase family 16 protein n=1 Tax=Hebeloma cylindrosporum TaxID=76867 RepID=A0A0C2YDQ1_HEBCY|nr:glycoside hydrolase family 16 protein [Hebeloma cylindrosporum h7]